MRSADTHNAYSRRTIEDPTADAPGSIWIACDESGQDGENLQAAAPVYASGSVRMDDAYAECALLAIRSHIPKVQSRELKFRHINTAAGREVLSWALSPDGPLHARAKVNIVHKPYVAASKVIDLLIEEQANQEGRDIYSTYEARRMARVLFCEGPRALGKTSFNRLIEAFTALFRSRSSEQSDGGDPVEQFFAVVDDVRFTSSRRSVEEILQEVFRARAHAELFRQSLAAGNEVLPALDPAIPSITQTVRAWAEAMPSNAANLCFLHDKTNVLTDGRIDLMLQTLRRPHPDLRSFTPPIKVKTLLRGDSTEHASLQLADLIAGLGRAAAEAALGAGATDWPVELVGPIIDPIGLWGHEESWVRLTGRRLDDPAR